MPNCKGKGDSNKMHQGENYQDFNEDVLKTSFVVVFRRRLDQDEYVRPSQRLQNTSSRRLQGVLIKTNIFVLAIRLKGVFKTSSRRLQDVLPRRLQHVLKTSSRHFQDIFKTSWQDIFKTSSKLLQDVFQKRLQDVFKTS